MFFCSLATAHLDYHISFSLSSIIFYFFQNFLSFCFALLRALRYSITTRYLCQQLFLFFSLLIFHKSLENFFSRNPCGVSHKKTTFVFGGCSQTQRVGFEPTCPLGQTVFKTASLWPLRYLCLTLIRLLFRRRYQRQDVYYHMCFYMSTPFFNFLYFSFYCKNFSNSQIFWCCNLNILIRTLD